MKQESGYYNGYGGPTEAFAQTRGKFLSIFYPLQFIFHVIAWFTVALHMLIIICVERKKII